MNKKGGNGIYLFTSLSVNLSVGEGSDRKCEFFSTELKNLAASREFWKLYKRKFIR